MPGREEMPEKAMCWHREGGVLTQGHFFAAVHCRLGPAGLFHGVESAVGVQWIRPKGRRRGFGVGARVFAQMQILIGFARRAPRCRSFFHDPGWVAAVWTLLLVVPGPPRPEKHSEAPSGRTNNDMLQLRPGGAAFAPEGAVLAFGPGRRCSRSCWGGGAGFRGFRPRPARVGSRSIQKHFRCSSVPHFQLAIFSCCDIELMRFSGHGYSASGTLSSISQKASRPIEHYVRLSPKVNAA